MSNPFDSCLGKYAPLGIRTVATVALVVSVAVVTAPLWIPIRALWLHFKDTNDQPQSPPITVRVVCPVCGTPRSIVQTVTALFYDDTLCSPFFNHHDHELAARCRGCGEMFR